MFGASKTFLISRVTMLSIGLPCAKIAHCRRTVCHFRSPTKSRRHRRLVMCRRSLWHHLQAILRHL